MKDKLQTDRLIIVIGSFVVLSCVAFFRQNQVLFQLSVAAVFLILFFRYLFFLYNDSRASLPDNLRSQEASKMLSELVIDMDVKTTAIQLKVSPQLKGARTFGKTIEVGSALLFGLDDIALKGILAHELGHIKKRHALRSRLSLFVFLPALLTFLLIAVSKYFIVVSVLLFLIGVLAWSCLSWSHEFEADAEGAKCVGTNKMAHALEECSKFIYRPGGTLQHPSFKNRILRVSPN